MCNVTLENYSFEGVMVECPDRGIARMKADEEAEKLGKKLQEAWYRPVLRNNKQHWFFTFEVEDNCEQV